MVGLASQPETWARGSVLYLDYGEAGEPWHERVLLQHVGREDWVVLTPDLDVYVESCAAPFVRDIRLSPALWMLPADLGEDKGQPVYRFDEADRFSPAGQKEFLAGDLAPPAVCHLCRWLPTKSSW